MKITKFDIDLSKSTKELSESIEDILIQLLEKELAQQTLELNFNLDLLHDLMDTKTVDAEDVDWMGPDDWNAGYWYNKINGKILTDEQIEILNLNKNGPSV